ncbi:MAG: CubicO group peptidase (beta-lactamase class C family) [Cyclobacteriaceae bacterium]|jgi:CubicO group peptidase (beta-lactamase class C family)
MRYLSIITLFLFQLIFCTEGLAKFDSLAFQKYQEIENSLVLIKNDNDILPLKNLETLDIMSLSLSSQLKEFHNRINSYKEARNIKGEISRLELEENLIILAVNSHDSPSQSQVDGFINTVGGRADLKFVLIVNSLEWLAEQEDIYSMSDAIIYIPISQALSYDLAVQAVFGGIGITGKLEENKRALIPDTMTYSTESIQRLKYTLPEEVGIHSDSLDIGIEKIVQEGLDSMAYPGCQVLVAKDGKVIFQKSYGYHTYDKRRAVIDTDIYDLASVSKVTGATTALMKLYDDGKFDLDAKFISLWPAFDKTEKKDIIIRDVLAHNARLLPYITYYQHSQRKNGKYKWNSIKSDSSKRFPQRLSATRFLHKDYKEKKIYKMINASPLNEEPGYKYSGLSFFLYPEITFNLTGQKYDDYLYENFYDKLGASTVRFNPLEKFPVERIVPTENDDFFRMVQLRGTVHDEGAEMMKGVSGNAGIFANANDLAKVWQMYLNGGTYGGEQFIAKETIDEFTKCQFCEQDNRRGLGFDKPEIEYNSDYSSVAEASSPNSFGHSGYTGIFVWADPDNQLLYIFMSNRVYPTRKNTKLYGMAIRPRIHTVLYDLLSE